MKIFIKEVPNCYSCPMRRVHGNFYGVCDLEGKELPDLMKENIPKWCPLPDKKKK